jgi:hypothetical protein
LERAARPSRPRARTSSSAAPRRCRRMSILKSVQNLKSTFRVKLIEGYVIRCFGRSRCVAPLPSPRRSGPHCRTQALAESPLKRSGRNCSLARSAASRRGEMCVLDPAIRIAAGHPFAGRPGVESIPLSTPQNRSDNDTHVGILQDDAPWSIAGGEATLRR